MELCRKKYAPAFALYAQEGIDDPIVHVRHFTPDSNWYWYATEGSKEGDNFIFLDTSSALKRNGDILHCPN
jgi:hypothetical protein